MIDCNVTQNYFSEVARMCTAASEGCCNCPLSMGNNGTTIACNAFERTYPEKAIAIVQAWSDAHPPRTYLSALLEAFPNTEVGENGTPGFCPSAIGFANRKECCDGDAPCPACWAQEIKQ